MLSSPITSPLQTDYVEQADLLLQLVGEEEDARVFMRTRILVFSMRYFNFFEEVLLKTSTTGQSSAYQSPFTATRFHS